MCARLENSTLLGATPSTGNDEDTISCLSVLTELRSKYKFEVMKGKPLSSKCQASSVFDDSPGESKQKTPFTALLSFSNGNKGKKKRNKCKYLKNK
jgi:hypothetical protein